MNILLTGVTGFLGTRLAETFNVKSDVSLTATARRFVVIPATNIVEMPGLDSNIDWSTTLCNQQVVIHTAARAHLLKDEVSDPLAEYRRVMEALPTHYQMPKEVSGLAEIEMIEEI